MSNNETTSTGTMAAEVEVQDALIRIATLSRWQQDTKSVWTLKAHNGDTATVRGAVDRHGVECWSITIDTDNGRTRDEHLVHGLVTVDEATARGTRYLAEAIAVR